MSSPSSRAIYVALIMSYMKSSGRAAPNDLDLRLLLRYPEIVARLSLYVFIHILCETTLDPYEPVHSIERSGDARVSSTVRITLEVDHSMLCCVRFVYRAGGQSAAPL